MLYLLTGDIQSGKTRWLERAVAGAAAHGVPVSGVLAPGVWRDHGAGAEPKARFEKLGIDNVLLPGGERVHLARRRDLAVAAGVVESGCQSERAGLGWVMDEGALARVDAHIARLAERAEAPDAAPGLLVIDELGPLELLRGGGLASAVELLRRGPSAAYPDAVAVVRRSLLARAHELFDAPWGSAVREVEPGSFCVPFACSC